MAPAVGSRFGEKVVSQARCSRRGQVVRPKLDWLQIGIATPFRKGRAKFCAICWGFCAIYRLAAMAVRHVCRSFKKEWAAPGRPFGTSASTEGARRMG